MKYKLIVYGNKLYKETIVPEEVEDILIGTCKEAQIRLPRKSFPDDFEIRLQRQGEKYLMICQQGKYILSNQGNKEYMHEFVPGDRVRICYEENDIVALRIDFSLDFGQVQDDYHFMIDTNGVSAFSIGGAGSDIVLAVQEIGTEKCIIRRNGDSCLKLIVFL